MTKLAQFGWFPQDLGWFSSTGSVPWVGTAPGCVCLQWVPSTQGHGRSHACGAACSHTLSSNHAGAPTPWQRGTNRSVLGGCLQVVAGSCYGTWEAGERSPPDGHCQQLAAPTRLACKVSLPTLFPESRGGWMDTHRCVFGHMAAASCGGGCQGRWHFCWLEFSIHSAAN